MSVSTFGAVLAAQALYGVLQIVVDNGAAWHGARLAATETLDDGSRGSLVRIRFQIAIVAACIGVAIGAAGGTTSLVATLPFMAALVLFALLNVWEPFGLGDARPWSLYILARSTAPAAAALALLAAGASFPPVLAGLLEVVVIVGVAQRFRLGLWRSLQLGLRASGGPWRSVTEIGLTAVIGQFGLASGTVILNAVGAPAAAAQLAVSVRLLTGANGISGILVTALFPQLAREAPEVSERAATIRAGAARVAVRAMTLIGTMSTGIYLLAPSIVMGTLLNETTASAETTGALVIAAVMAAGLVLFATSILVAQHGEAKALRANFAGTTVTVVCGATSLAFVTSSVAFAAALLAGQAVSAITVARSVRRTVPETSRAMWEGVAATVVLTAAGVAAAAAPDSRGAIGAMLLFAALAVAPSVFVGSGRLHREPRVRGDPRRRQS